MEAPARGRARSGDAVLLLLLFATIALLSWNAWSVTPLGGYDAGGHAGYVATIVAEGRIPHPDEGWSTFHPPFYYVVSSALWRLLEPLGPQAILVGLRLPGTLGVLAAGIVAFVLARRTSGSRSVAALAAALVVFVPCAQMAAAMVSNEALAAGLGALVLLPLLALQRNPGDLRAAALTGALAGLAFATKFSGAYVVAACALPFLRKDLDRRALRAMALAAGIGILIAGPVYVRNVMLTGNPFPTAQEVRAIAERADAQRPRQLGDYLWLDPACLARPSIHHVAGPAPAPPRRNPAMTNVWGLLYASTWYDAFGHRVPLSYHRDGVVAGPLLAALGLAPTLAMLAGFALALGEAVRTRGRSPDAPLVAVWIAGLSAFVIFTWTYAPMMGAVKGCYLLPLAAPGAAFFARAAARLGRRPRAALLALSALAVLGAATIFANRVVFPPIAPELMAGRWKLVGTLLPESHIREAVELLVNEQPRVP